MSHWGPALSRLRPLLVDEYLDVDRIRGEACAYELVCAYGAGGAELGSGTRFPTSSEIADGAAAPGRPCCGRRGITFKALADRRDRKAEIEEDAAPLHNQICGARMGRKNGSMPFVRLTLYPTFALLSYAKNIVLPYEAIESVTVERGIVGRGVRIRHHESRAPERLTIWSTDVDALRKKLSNLIEVRADASLDNRLLHTWTDDTTTGPPPVHLDRGRDRARQRLRGQ